MNKKILYGLIFVLLLGIVFLTYNLFFKENKIGLTSEECFEINSETGSITGYKDICGTELNIPNKIKGITVKEISKFVFSNKGITKIILPDTLEVIGIGAFENNQIKSLVIPDSVKNIKPYAFHKNMIEKLTIGTGVTNIGIEAFNDNNMPKDGFIYMRSESGIIEDTIIGYAGKEREKVIIPDGTDILYLSALADCSIKQVILNEELTRLESRSLENNEIEEIVIPKNVIIIGEGTFNGNNLVRIIVEGKNTLEDFSLFGSNEIDNNIIEFKKD